MLVDPVALVPVACPIPRLNGPELGLGVEIDEDAARTAVDNGRLASGSPVWHYPDGGFAER